MADTSKHKVYWFLDKHFGRAWNNFKTFVGHPSDPSWIRWLVDSIHGYYPTDMNEDWPEYKEELDERHAYAECHKCSNRVLVKLNVFMRLANGTDWHFDPEDLPEGWSYTIEPYPSTKNLIYCPDHSEETQNE